MRTKLGVFLLSHKRPQFIIDTIDSILAQDYQNFDLIISENSPDDSIIELLLKYESDPRVIIVKRKFSLPSLKHFKTVIEESTQYTYAMIFHDDDILKPGALSKMMKRMETNPTYAAVACNATLIKDRQATQEIFSPGFMRDVEINDSKQLIRRYIFKSLGHPPFPSYIYNTQFLKGLSLNPDDGGKYSDTSFLIKLVERGPFYWIAEPNMAYRQHSHNDSANLNLKDIKSLSLFFLKKQPGLFLQIGFYYFKQLIKKILMRL